MRGKFITVEGIDGSGKTTVVERVTRELEVVNTREPTSMWTGDIVRKSIRKDTDAAPPLTTLFQFMADRAHHIDRLVEPSLESGWPVLSDRYHDSTLAYQQVALADQFGSQEEVRQYLDALVEPWLLVPDLTLYLKVDVETGLSRMGGEQEYENREFLRKVKRNYDDLAEEDRFKTIDATQSLERVVEDSIEAIEEII